MDQHRTAVTLLLSHWSYCSLAQSHRYVAKSVIDNVLNSEIVPHHAPYCLLYMYNIKLSVTTREAITHRTGSKPEDDTNLA